MDLFSLVAKLTLDKNEFERDLDEAERDLGGIDVPDTKLELDNNDFNSELAESQGLGDTFGKDMEGVFNGIKTALTVTGIVGAITSIVDKLKQAVEMTAETADGIDKGSKKLNISTKAYQEWDHALKQSGSSIDVVKKGIMQFQAAIKAADPATPFADAEDQVDGLADKTAGLSSDAYEALRDLGLLERLQAGEFQNAEEMMNAALLKLAEFDATDDAQRNERGILTRKLFGRGGDELNALLDEGKEGVQALLTEASDLGLIMSDDEITNAVAYGDAVANLNAELDAIQQAFVEDIIPVLTEAVGWLTEFLQKLNPRLQTSSIFDVFNQIDSKTLAASRKVDEANTAAKKLIEDLQAMGDYWSLDEQGRMTWDALAAKALELFPQLSEYIDTDGKKIQGNTKDIEDNIDAWSRLEKQRLLSAAMDEKREAVAKQLIDAYEKGADAAAEWDAADGKRATAIKQFNDLMEKSGRSERLGENASFEEIKKLRDDLVEKMDLANFTMVMDAATKDYLDAAGNAKSMREESEKMIADAEKAQEELDDYEKRLSDSMGLTADRLREAQREAEEYYKVLSKIPRHINTRVGFDGLTEHTHAIGSAYIPYDNYPALLHRGERVLTSTEARQGGGEIDYTALEDKIIAAIRQGMDGATVRSYINGRDVTDEVNRNNMQGVKGRRYRP